MKWRNVGVVLVLAGTLAGITFGAATLVTSQDATDAQRLSVIIVGQDAHGDEGVLQCFFDARVSIDAGRVANIDAVADGVADRVQRGIVVVDLPAGLEGGETIPGPIYIDNDGVVRAGYAYCNEEARR